MGDDDVRPFAEGETVLLRRREGDWTLVPLRKGSQAVEGRGVVDLTDQIGQRPGGWIVWAGTRYQVLRPSLPDLTAAVRRRAQIVTPKDAQYLLYLAGIGPGARVAEAGAGSGALTLVLAHAVGPTGHVLSFDRRPDFLDIARANVAVAGWSDRVTFALRDVVADGFEATGLDAVVLDLPDPWAALGAARAALALGGRVASYSPTYNQVERTVRTLEDLGFQEVRSVELLERGIHVGEGGTRPEFEMLGHTGFLTAARRIE